MYQLLNGVTVIEVSSFVASPTIGLYLAQMGARVIRVDQIEGGQDFKRWPVTENNDSLSWENLNRAKQSLTLDFSKPEARELLQELIGNVGNLVTNLPATGFLSHEKLAQKRPDLISVRVMGWPDGSIALDYTANAAVGYPVLTGPGPEPVNNVLPAWDLLTGAYGAFAFTAALRQRELTGKGEEIRLPLTDVAVGSVANMGRVAEVLYHGKDRERLGNAVYGTIGRDFLTRDNQRIMIVAINERQWGSLVKTLDMGDEIARLESELGVSFAGDDGLRFTHREAIFAIIGDKIGARDLADVGAAFEKAGVVSTTYRNMLETVKDPRLVGDNPIFSTCDDNPSGFSYPAAGPFATLPDQTRGPVPGAPRVGAHSEQVLADLMGLEQGRIAELIDAGIVGTD